MRIKNEKELKQALTERVLRNEFADVTKRAEFSCYTDYIFTYLWATEDKTGVFEICFIPKDKCNELMATEVVLDLLLDNKFDFIDVTLYHNDSEIQPQTLVTYSIKTKDDE